MELDKDYVYVDDMVEKADNLRKEKKENRLTEQELKNLKEYLTVINLSVKYLASERQMKPRGNSIERIIYKADWECVSLLTDKVEELLNKL